MFFCIEEKELLDYIFYVLIGIGVVILLICLSVATQAGANMLVKFEQINKHLSSSFTVSHVFATEISKKYFDGKIKVAERIGFLTDAYMPKRKAIFLSEEIFGNSSVASLAITAHELGHAYQDFLNPHTLKSRDRLGFVAKFFGFFMLPLLILGIIMFFANENPIYSIIFLALAVGIFILALIVKLSTIKIEKQASKFALDFLKENYILNDDELKEAKKLLDSALLTYIADFLRAILSWTFLTPKTKLF